MASLGGHSNRQFKLENSILPRKFLLQFKNFILKLCPGVDNFISLKEPTKIFSILTVNFWCIWKGSYFMTHDIIDVTLNWSGNDTTASKVCAKYIFNEVFFWEDLDVFRRYEIVSNKVQINIVFHVHYALKFFKIRIFTRRYELLFHILIVLSGQENRSQLTLFRYFDWTSHPVQLEP